MNPEEVPDLMTVEDIAEYGGVSVARAREIAKAVPVVGGYTPPKRQPVALYSSFDLGFLCENAHFNRARRACRKCKYLAKYGAAA